MRILHVPYTYAPNSLGGTEFYVRALAKGLVNHNCSSVIAAPAVSSSHFWDNGIEVFRFNIGSDSSCSEGVPDQVAAESFNNLLGQVKPQIVHLHARTAAVSELLLEIAHSAGVRTVVTYHTPTLSCPRGTMMFDGAYPCDGVLDAFRCTRCVLRKYRLLKPFPSVLARIPAPVGRMLKQLRFSRGPWLALRMRQIVEDHILRTHHFLSRADLVIAPCQWVANLLLANGFPAERLRLCRQGLAHPATIGTYRPVARVSGRLRLGFFGRLDPTKGIEVMIKAMRRIPRAPLDLLIYGVAQQGSEVWSNQLHAMARNDPRIRFEPPLDPDQVLPAMAQLDLVLVPSLWMETGPLVVLEAFGAHTPVLGSDLGGIRELVHKNVNGLLLVAGDETAWADALAKLAADPSPIKHWRAQIQMPRSMDQVVIEMVDYYRELMIA